MPELSQVEKDGVVYDLKDITARGMIPFANVKTKLIVDMTIPTDENGALPTYVEVTQRDDGTPLNLKAFVMQSDIKSVLSYTQASYNNFDWGQSFPGIPHGNRNEVFIAVVTKDGSLFTNKGLYPVGANTTNSGTQPKVDTVDKIKIPATHSIQSGTFIKIWEIMEDKQ